MDEFDIVQYDPFMGLSTLASIYKGTRNPKIRAELEKLMLKEIEIYAVGQNNILAELKRKQIKAVSTNDISPTRI